MKRIVGIVAALVVLLGVFALVFVLPTLRLKRGLDTLEAALPAGITFSYQDAHYALFAHRVTLENATLTLAAPALKVQADSIEIDRGNPDLQKAIEEARRTPNLQNGETTPLADRIVMTNLHTVYDPLDVRVGRAVIEDAQISLRQIFAPLPRIEGSQGDPAYAGALQRVALDMAATAYKHAELDALAMNVLTDEGQSPGQTVTFRMAALVSDGFDHGNIADTTMKGFDVASGTFDMHVETIAAGNTMHRDFWTALRDGDPLDTAVEKFQGASQTVRNVTATSNGKQVASLDALTVGNIGYRGGLPVSMDIQMTKLDFDPLVLPYPGIADALVALGYKTATLDGHIGYAWDQKAQTIRIDPAIVTLDQGGTLTFSASVLGADPLMPFSGYKLGAASLRYDDASLVSKWLGYVATQTNRKPEDIQAAYGKWLEQQKPAFKNDPALSAAFGGLESFIKDPHSLLISLTPPQPVAISQYDGARPQAFTSRLGLKVTAQATPH